MKATRYAEHWDGTPVEAMTSAELEMAERLLTERHIELSAKHGLAPLDLSECEMLALGHRLVVLNHPEHGNIGTVVVPMRKEA